ncbi:acyl-homoserine-lactone synthase [Phaeobacter sp. JH20_36]|uniref:acyl-homoserine-lactone synthase n=2 Tax=Phaeobacter TaxID=302485 RepID=UPI003A87294F
MHARGRQEQLAGSRMQSTDITFDNFGETGALFTELLRARYRHFVKLRRWDLPNVRGLEFDQYDTPESIYCAVHDGMAVLGGFRLTPTTAQCMNTSYMLRDAQLGLLPGLPSNVLDDAAPQDPGIWEVSRFFVEDTLGARDRMRVRRLLEQGFARFARDWNIDTFLCITSVTAALLMRRASLSISSAGPRFEAGGEICQAYHLSVVAKSQRSDAA